LRAFKAKFKPRAWDPIFLSYPRDTNSFVALFDTLKAFARGGLLRFGLETFLRGPAVVVRALAILLVTWTVLLALPSSGGYFPNAAWQYGWVAFDLALGAALLELARRWRQPLADIVAATVTLDAATTLVQAIAFDVPRATGIADPVVIAIAIAAPTIASFMLWN